MKRRKEKQLPLSSAGRQKAERTENETKRTALNTREEELKGMTERVEEEEERK